MIEVPCRFEKVPCKCGEKHENERKTWMWSKAKIEAINDDGSVGTVEKKVMRCRKCRQIIWLQTVAVYD